MAKKPITKNKPSNVYFRLDADLDEAIREHLDVTHEPMASLLRRAVRVGFERIRKGFAK